MDFLDLGKESAGAVQAWSQGVFLWTRMTLNFMLRLPLFACFMSRIKSKPSLLSGIEGLVD